MMIGQIAGVQVGANGTVYSSDVVMDLHYFAKSNRADIEIGTLDGKHIAMFHINVGTEQLDGMIAALQALRDKISS